jgi:amino acid permease
MLVLYLTIAVGGFLLYGGEVKPNVLENLPASVIKTLIGVLMAFHVFAAMLIVINPVNLSFEQTIRLTDVTG